MFEAMKAISSETNTPTGRGWVLFGRPLVGEKKSAGQALLEHAGRVFEIKRSLFVTKPADCPRVTVVLKHIGVPHTGDLEWVTTLFGTLSGVEIGYSLHSFWG
mmetsp:Transcript_8951/g.24814  ORF Transcript_8951/g.24814 Transcript_8951/m.24814 type:complete len:103 (-) Transcript_8951:140-448(-)